MPNADSQDIHTDLAHALQEYWGEYTGIRPTRVRVVSGEGAIVVWLENVLSPAERQMSSTPAGRKVLRDLEERIVEQARPQMQRLVEAAVGQESAPARVLLDVENGSVLGFFQLA